MARPTKQGIDYFPLDVHTDDKFKFIEIKFGLKGFAIIIKLLQRIYASGYWCKFGEDESLIFAHENNIENSLLNEIVDEAIKRRIFSSEMHEKHQILTSSGIQKRYKEIVKRRRDVEISAEYLLVDNNFGVNVYNNPPKCKHDANTKSTASKHDDSKSTQSKVKESKVKESTNSNNSKFSFQKSMVEYGFDEKLITEWLIIRKSKKAVNSELAFKNFIREVEKTDMNKYGLKNKDDLMYFIAVKKQWRGYEAKWLDREFNGQNNGSNPDTDRLAWLANYAAKAFDEN